ncbi:hypothetical protein PTTG_01326, partial [Puccinia triticina 1-1 BBBD Race 1]
MFDIETSYISEQTTGPPLHYQCCWCPNIYKWSEETRGNLIKHQDGNLKRAPCPGRLDAIKAGAKLPLTLRDIKAKQKAKQVGMVAKFVKHGEFDNKLLNMMLVMWLIRSSLPWTRLEDSLLSAAFHYVRRGGLDSKITLIHDIWTTKGNHHAFMGISAGYISKDWVNCVSHLGMKYIAWTHWAQTADSGSNNGTMAAEVDRLILKNTGTDIDLSSNHIRCFCHKIALILNAGLKALDLSPSGLTKQKHSTLGFVPGLDAIVEESNIIDDSGVVLDLGPCEPKEIDSENNSQSDDKDV